MKISEITFTVNEGGSLRIPSHTLREMGIAPGDHVRVAYLTDNGERNTFKEFLLTPEGIEYCEEPQQIVVPVPLLQQAGIPENADIQIVCLNGALVIMTETALNQTELLSVLDGLLTAAELVSELPDDATQAQMELADAVNEYGEV